MVTMEKLNKIAIDIVELWYDSWHDYRVTNMIPKFKTTILHITMRIHTVRPTLRIL